MGGSKVDIPTEYTVHLNPVQLAGGADIHASLDVAGVAGRPLFVDAGLDDVNVALTGNPAEPVTLDLGLDDIKVSLAGDPAKPVRLDLGLDKICVKLALTEIPRVQVHIPTKYDFGFCLFGIPIFNFTLAGETMFVTQENPPRIFHSPAKRPPPARGHTGADSTESAETTSTEVRIRLGDE